MKTSCILLAVAMSATTSFATFAALPVFERFAGPEEARTSEGAVVRETMMHRNADAMTVNFTLDLTDLKMKGDRAIVYTPIIRNGNDSLELTPVSVYGRTRWIQYSRTGKAPGGASMELAYQYKDRPSTIDYSQTVGYADWMNGAELLIRRSDYGCCNSLKTSEVAQGGRWTETVYEPSLAYVRPAGVAEKRYELQGQSYIDFPVNKTDIYPDYRNNATELDSIRRTIDIARNNPDARIDTIRLKGYASPEGPYANNARLAQGRTAALRDYINRLYNFNGVTLLTSSEPEDWAGLRTAVENSGLAHRSEIISIIDSNMEPDPKEWKIKSTYPEEYRFMLENYYPALRHTDYKVSYTVRSYSDPAEILAVMKTRPGTLSLNEFYIAGSSLEPGTPEFNEVFETAALMFPTDEAANLNAASAALAIGDLRHAERYLAKAGNGPEALYTRSVLATMEGDFATARDYLNRALAAGYTAPAGELESLREVIER